MKTPAPHKDRNEGLLRASGSVCRDTATSPVSPVVLLSLGQLPGLVAPALHSSLCKQVWLPVMVFLSDSASVTSANLPLRFSSAAFPLCFQRFPTLLSCSSPGLLWIHLWSLSPVSKLLPEPCPGSSADTSFYFFQRLLTQWHFHTSPLELEQAKLLPGDFLCLIFILFLPTEGLHVVFPLQTTSRTQLDGLFLHQLTGLNKTP